MRTRFLKRSFVHWILALGLLANRGAVGATEPKLVVAIMVDQMRYDYLERFASFFSTNGFRLLMDRGAFMTFGRYNYVPTVTGAGHASYLSGAGPAEHGIIGNSWFDKVRRKNVYCVGDSSVEVVGSSSPDGGMSPRNLIGGNLADQMRLQFGSKVISAALKDRAAVLPGGKKPAGAYWYDGKTGRFVSSTYYMAKLPPWVEAFNARQLPQSYVGQVWKRLLPPEQYAYSDAGYGEGHLDGETNSTFDHVVGGSANGFDGFFPTPFGDEYTTEFAMTALDAEGLGQGPHPDMLCLSFSSLDACGHTFGPYSHEVQDLFIRLDRQLERLFARIDQRIGLSNVVIVMSADHGVAPTPEFASAMGLDGSRQGSGFMTDLMERLDKEYGAGKYFLTPGLVNGHLYLNPDTLREKQLSPATVAALIRDYALSTGFFQAGYTRDQLLEGRAPGWIGQCVLNGYNAERGGDVVLVGKPYLLPGKKNSGTDHGSPYGYDTRVPILFYGAPFKPGRYADEFYVSDIAATLATALRIEEPPLSIGKPCVRILGER